MLTELSIRNIVLIEKLSLSWKTGLCVLTGETGAGKSILLDALGLATGARGDAGLVRHGANQGSVTAVFEITEDSEVWALLSENEIEPEPTLILRRVQNADGRSRAFCNDQAISAQLLRKIGNAVLEIHGQHETLSLADSEKQLLMLDSYADLLADRTALVQLYEARQSARADLVDFERDLEKAEAEADYIANALSELKELAPQAGEEDELAQERAILLNSDKIFSCIQSALTLLQDNEQMVQIIRHIERANDYAQSAFAETLEGLERALAEFTEAENSVQALQQKFQHDPERLSQVEDRLFALRGLARKHNVMVDELPRVLTDLQQKAAQISDSGAHLAKLKEAVAVADAAYQDKAVALSKARQKAATRLDGTVNAELPALKLDGGHFITRIETRAQGNATGIDGLVFEVQTNPGVPAAPLSKIASGGELARFMLALKVALHHKEGSGASLIFDEVDAGVGGAVAAAVGQRLHDLSRHQQILVVTHSPQLAAKGDQHWYVAKTTNADAVISDVIELDEEARIEEIARMLSGTKITDDARAAARALSA